MNNKSHKDQIKECTYYVEGMHCASCEILIEKSIMKKKNIKAVDASAESEEVRIMYKGNKPKTKELNDVLENDDYRIFDTSEKEETSQLIFQLTANGKVVIDRKRFWDICIVIVVSILILAGFLLLSSSGLVSLVSVNSNSSLLAFLLFGLIAGASTCAALVGGIVLAMSKQWSQIHDKSQSSSKRFEPHVLFNSGRIVSFTVFGAVLGTIGSLFQFSLSFTSVLTILVSIVMLFLALQMLGFKRFRKFQFTAPKFITRYVADERNFSGKYMPFLMGALTFILPCGFTITAQGLALASGNASRGALIMLFFSLGTLPMLLIIGFSSVKFTQKPHFSKKFMKVAGLLVLFFGLYNINSQLNVLGAPSLSDINFASNKDTSIDGLPPIIDGKQVIEMDAFSGGYSPNKFTVRVGVPVKWIISDEGTSGCTNAVISKGLFDGEIKLTPGKTSVKEFTPETTGKYKFSCWMGMVSGLIEVIDEENYDAKNIDENEITNEIDSIPSGSSSCGGSETGSKCAGDCGEGCGNPGCPYAE